MNHAWTRTELEALLPKLQSSLRRDEEEAAAQGADLRGLPPMTKDEARHYIERLSDLAMERRLSLTEAMLFGGLLASFEMAVKAEMLGKKGARYYVIEESQIADMLGEQRQAAGSN